MSKCFIIILDFTALEIMLLLRLVTMKCTSGEVVFSWIKVSIAKSS